MKSLAFPARLASSSREARTRLPRGPLVVMVLGASLMIGHGFVQDYAQALVSPDGLYIPDARYVIPPNTPTGNFTHTFRIYNARPWKISLEANADCGCTGLSWKDARIAPFGWKDIVVEMDILKEYPNKSISVSMKNKYREGSYLFAYMRK